MRTVDFNICVWRVTRLMTAAIKVMERKLLVLASAVGLRQMHRCSVSQEMHYDDASWSTTENCDARDGRWPEQRKEMDRQYSGAV